jgi:hypothetical protein
MSNIQPGRSKLTRDPEKLTEQVKSATDSLDRTVNSLGLSGDNIPELNPEFDQLPYETVHRGKHDTTIVLGRDRTGPITGYGIKASTSCAAIDIVVGRKSGDEKYNIRTQKAPPDFIYDAARIYISQKTDIDKSFNIPTGKSGAPTAKSGIAIKADETRIIARESLKLVVGTDAVDSVGLSIQTFNGVELIAGKLELANRAMTIEDNSEDQIEEISKGGMQPIPLGINTAYALDRIIDKIDKLSGVVSTMALNLSKFMISMAPHTHENLLNTYFGVPVLPSDESIEACVTANFNLMQHTIADLKLFSMELEMYKGMHLKPAGAYYINSKHHTLN